MLNNFGEYFQRQAAAIDTELAKRLQAWTLDIEKTTPGFSSFAQTFADACAGGKRIRGSLVLLGYELAGSKNCSNILAAATAYEIFQTAILAHDDIIDQSATRRGRPALHTALGSDQRAISYAICLGDVGFFLAYQILNELDCDPELKNSALKTFSLTTVNTAIGEILDIQLSDNQNNKLETDTLTMLNLKTAWYTIIGPLQLGAILGGADNKLLDEIKQFGKKVGIAFQIQDDILGTFGDQTITGKSITSDIHEGKSTLLISHALAHANDEDKKTLIKFYGNKSITDSEISLIKEIFINTGSLTHARTRCDDLSNSAIASIQNLTKNEKMSNILSGLIDYTTKRER